MDDRTFLQQFQDCTLPFAQWNHRAHVKAAYLHAGLYSFDQALAGMRTGIKAYNAQNHVPETDSSGYNETTTVAFFLLIASTLHAYNGIFPTRTSDEFCDRHPHLLQKTILRLFYSPERRGHPKAKSEFIEPDLAKLPEIPASRPRPIKPL
jgi:hypothetical protein